ncbi:PhzF family phenazine biosynthesis protein [Bradyrhizobium icense]|uniref:Phenazine biosynthesis protein PhzF n=1 Tax=Bradyrhizobium icense TaxID=1274631 RepID=A0A1B1UBN1_9BRAD|nr:PhzF family phenazine biosynthesis protein [Bradyrhizobium icense]ANW00169.1 phenazine biosynthesis protein PhzF [Bradyrhizobium icense]
MREYAFHTVDVFTQSRFGGNPLAVFPDARGLDATTMQLLAAEMNYSETTFVLPPDNPAHTARVRIFNRVAEMPFAGHPNVGTAFVLARLGLGTGPVLLFEEIAGLVEVRLTREGYSEIDAPQPLKLIGELPVEAIAACLSVDPKKIATRAHAPVRASVGLEFVLVEVESGALAVSAPDIGAFRRCANAIPNLGERLSIFLYARDGFNIRARMFAPLSGTWEDPATGSANATLAALLLSLNGGERLAYHAVQGSEMGRRSELSLRAWRARDGIRASVGGSCIPVFSGTVKL